MPLGVLQSHVTRIRTESATQEVTFVLTYLSNRPELREQQFRLILACVMLDPFGGLEARWVCTVGYVPRTWGNLIGRRGGCRCSMGAPNAAEIIEIRC